jgi:hypothetical protein
LCRSGEPTANLPLKTALPICPPPQHHQSPLSLVKIRPKQERTQHPVGHSPQLILLN